MPADAGTDDTDEALMLAYGRGDATAFERLYARHRGPTYRYLLRHASERSVADELHQDVWMSVIRARERYAADARFTTWVYTLARHRLIDHWRARRGARFTSLDEGSSACSRATRLGLRRHSRRRSVVADDRRANRPAISRRARRRTGGPARRLPAAPRPGLSLEEINTGAPVETVRAGCVTPTAGCATWNLQ
jgi:RNA polymerase sigma factor (sigma-70 family)